MSNRLTKELTNKYLAKKGFFAPEQVGYESDGALEYDQDEASYMSPNFSAQIFRELSDRQEAGELSDGQIIDAQREPQAGRQGERVASHKRVAYRYLRRKSL